MELTKEQIEAVTTISKNMCCIASAGSGKTNVFTMRIAYMIKSGIDPESILAFTFTKKSAEEIYKRLYKLIGKSNAQKVTIGTFHSVAYGLLKKFHYDFSKYNIAPDWWRFNIFFDMCKLASYKNPNGLDLGIKAGELATFISYQKSNMVELSDDVIVNDDVEFAKFIPKNTLQEAYKKYEELKENSRQIDFDDMLFMLYKNLKDNDLFRSNVQNKYKYVMIDEFQDTSLIVLEIVKMINDKNVFVVGDFRQSVYKFINARVENMLGFKDEFDNVKVIELNKNFRSTKNIVDFSNQIISNSPIEKYKEYKPSIDVKGEGEKVSLNIYQDEFVQAELISDEISKLHDAGTKLNEIAIMVRTNAQTAVFEEVLAEKDLPYEVSKSSSFFDRKEVLDVLSYARLAMDFTDDMSFRRIYNVPNRFLSKKLLNELDRYATMQSVNLLDAVNKAPCAKEGRYVRNLTSLTNTIYDLSDKINNKDVNAGKVLRHIVKTTSYLDHVERTSISSNSLIEKQEAIDKLCEMGAKFKSMKAFMAYILKIKDKQNKSKGKESVQIITIHSAKGLEWDACFVTNVNEGLLPHVMNGDIEEERRLFYVSASRPRKKLYVSWVCYDKDYEVIKESEFIRELLGEEQVKSMTRDIFNGKRCSTLLY